MYEHTEFIYFAPFFSYTLFNGGRGGGAAYLVHGA